MPKRAIALLSILNTSYALEPVDKDINSVETSLSIAKKLQADKVFHFIGKDQDYAPYKELLPNDCTYAVDSQLILLLQVLVKALRGYETIVLLYTDCPLNDSDVIKKLIELQENEIAEYSFTENYPVGIGGEALSYDMLIKLLNAAIKTDNKGAFHRQAIEKLVHMDINQYDVEVLVSDIDFRRERLELVALNKRNYLIIQKAIQILNDKQKIPSLNNIDYLIKKYPAFMRSIPAYIEIEITNDCNCKCPICPRTSIMSRPVQTMSLSQYETVLDKLKGFTEQAFISLSLMGEPFLHPNIIEIIQNTLALNDFSLIVETNGAFLSYELIDKLKEMDKDNKLFIILALDSPNKELYSSLRDDTLSFKQIEQNAFYLLDKGPTNSYLQILRLKENSDALDEFYNKWSAFKDKIILQKYNPYNNRLPDRKALDLSPIRRFSCWHLKRDMLILSDGTMPFCKQDINGDKKLGNVFTDDLHTIWRSLDSAFIQDHKGNIDPFCKDCDEWFTYNF